MNNSTWDVVKKRFSDGDLVTAEVVDQKPFGLLVLIEHDIPGVIERIGLFNNGYESLDEFPIGSTVEARILGFREWGKQVELQLPVRNQN